MEMDDHKALQEEIEHDLETNPRYAEFFKKFKTKSALRSFIGNYAYQKTNFLLFGKNYHKRIIDWQGDLLESAWEYLSIILQKKLFDLQCLWRAEKIKIPDIEICDQFDYWGFYIETCPFLDTITDEEYKTLCSFIAEKSNFYDIITSIEWQDYPAPTLELMQDPESQLLYWFEYYNDKLNTPDYSLIYDDIRGEKESKYDDRPPMSEEWSDLLYPEESESLYPIGIEKGALDEFMNRYENKKLHKYRDAHERKEFFTSPYLLPTLFEDAIEILRYSKEPVPIENHKKWYEAIIRSANNYWKAELFKRLESAYEEYSKTHKFPIKEKRESIYYENICSYQKKRIIEARLKRGEPGDLNF